MTWLTPFYGMLAAGVAIPTLLILYFLKLRRREVEISTTLLWKKAIQDLQANAPFQRLRRNILLLLQLLVLGGLLAAIAQPQIKGASSLGQRQVILIDRSASMGAIDGDGDPEGSASDPVTRLAAAKKEAVALVEALREPGIFARDAADEAMLIAFDRTAEVRQQFTSDKAALRAAIGAIELVDGPTRVSEALRLAKAHAPKRRFTDRDGSIRVVEGLSEGTPITIHLWTDGALPDVGEAPTSAEDTIVYHRVGTGGAGNLGIVGLRAERAYDAPSKLSVFVGIQSTFREPRTVDVEFVFDGVPAGVKAVAIPPGEMRTSEGAEAKLAPGAGGVVFAVERAEGALVRVRLRGSISGDRGPDVFETDDRGWLVVPPARQLSVALVSRGNLFLSAAMRGLPLSRLDVFTPDEFEKAVREGRRGDYDVVALDGWLPATPGAPPTTPEEGREVKIGLPPGRYLVFDAVPGGALVETGDAGTAQVIDWRRDHPVLRSVGLESLVIGKLRQVEPVPGAGAQVLARADKGPAIFDIQDSDARAIVCVFDSAQSNWPFEVSFVVFLASAINELGEGGAMLPGRMVQPGGVLSDRIPLGPASAELTLPGGEAAGVTPAADGSVVYGPVRTVGLYGLEWEGAGGANDEVAGRRVRRVYAANLLDSAESEIASAEKLGLASREVTAARTESEIVRKLWPWFVLGALAVIMLEWFVYNRKVHV